MRNSLLLIRATALVLGSAAAGVGCYAACEAAARADGGYLMVAAPVVALAAALIPCCFDKALHDRQWLRGVVLFVVWLPCAATVFYTAAERVHAAKASGEAERAALRLVVDRAKAELADAKAAATVATAAANKVRAGDGPKARSAKATETAAITRRDAAEKALTAAEAKAVTEASLKQPDWLQPLALDLAGMVLIGTGFGLGRGAPVPAAPVLTAKQIAARKGAETRKKNLKLRAKARKTGPRLVRQKA